MVVRREVKQICLIILGGSLASDDLYLLDLRSGDGISFEDKIDVGVWMVVPVVGTTPGRRYGHTLVFTKPFLLVHGGNTGQEPVNDCCNTYIYQYRVPERREESFHLGEIGVPVGSSRCSSIPFR